jgi:hypothetical protein
VIYSSWPSTLGNRSALCDYDRLMEVGPSLAWTQAAGCASGHRGFASGSRSLTLQQSCSIAHFACQPLLAPALKTLACRTRLPSCRILSLICYGPVIHRRALPGGLARLDRARVLFANVGEAVLRLSRPANTTQSG